MTTEAEAREKWCPFSEKDTDTAIGLNRLERCIASDCMAWRYIKADDNIEWYDGYCGLAGKP